MVAGVAAPALIWAAGAQMLSSASTVITCEVANACQITVNGGTASLSGADSEVLGASSDNTTNWTQGDFSADLVVHGNSYSSGTSVFATSTDLFGNLLAREVVANMSSSATTTACSILNNSGVSRLLTQVNVVDRGTASSLGLVGYTVGTSTASGVAPAFLNIVQGATTRVASSDTFTTTSTINSLNANTSSTRGNVLWQNGEYLNFQSSTTVNSGTCRALFL